MSKAKNSKVPESIILKNDEDTVEVFPRKSRLAKRIIIRVSHKKGIELIVPRRASMKSAMEFLRKKEAWVIQRSREIKNKSRIRFEEGAQISILGSEYTIEHSGAIRGITRLEGNKLIVSGLPEHTQRKTRQFLIKMAKDEITVRTGIESKKLGLKFKSITVRDTSSRWGSCSHDRNLSFSWRLILAPRPVMEYVVAHEVAHMKEMNHSDKFWDIVASLYPMHRQARRWLKIHGDVLHSYGE